MATEAPPKGSEKGKESKKEPRTLTPYTVFQNTAAADAPAKQWVEVGTAEGLSDVKAIQAFVANQGINEGEFVAIPTRSFRPRKVAVENKPRVRIG